MTSDLADPCGLEVPELVADELSGKIGQAIRANRLLEAGGVYGDPLVGDPLVGDPVQVDVSVQSPAGT